MAPENFNLGAAAFYISATCLIALAISLLFIKQLFISPKRGKSCYLNAEGKPQHTFKRILADNSYSQFKHLKLHTPDDEELLNLHPYKIEVSMLMKNPNVGFLEWCEKGVFEMRGSHVWVETETQLKELSEVLSREKVFGVDTEQHSFRSFLGFTALIQISTTRDDYLVDTIALHDVMGLLRPVFANPEICKVFHGADSDVLWLQRDFHIYVVNLFDTAKACDILSKPQRSLAYLLETYCSVSANKLLQREDWRQRPLPEEMIHYARADAHYLLYIAYCLCLELRQQKNENSSPGDKFHFLLEASRRSNATCLQLFAKDIEAGPGELAASSIISRCLNGQGHISSVLCDAKFQELVRQLCLWRDIMARLHDESLRFVLSENAIISLASEIPTTEKDICSTISKADGDLESKTLVPLQSPSPLVWCHLDDLIWLLREKTENIFQHFIQQHLGPTGSCPTSVYNYGLLSMTSLGLNHTLANNRNGFRGSKKKTPREVFVKKFSCKSPVYQNCKIYANDGRFLSYCDRKRLEWYVNKKLAKHVEDDDSPSIMLLFETKKSPEDEDNELYIHCKKNICVGCGEGKHYLRYRIIPSCYRVHFPERLKSSHDVVLICVGCHGTAISAAEKYKKEVAAEFGIPLFICKDTDTPLHSKENGVSPRKLRSAATPLLRDGPHIPSERREKLLQIVRTYYGGREVTDEDVERASVVGKKPSVERKLKKRRGYSHTFNYLSNGITENNADEENVDIVMLEDDTKLGHGKQVVMYLLKEYGEDGVRKFCQRWRQVFVNALHPRFLPAGWDVMHSGKRDFGEFDKTSRKAASGTAAAG